MLNIISEDSQFNSDLTVFPSANANIAIFGTQSSGKSTLLNHVFGTLFPVLDTKLARERCTKGVWFHNINGFNVIDTEGFDSDERDVEEKMFEKQMALFCLALSDVLIINLWMNEIGRYQASHTHILKAIIRASERVIAKQQRKIIFVVRDCTEDANRSILRDEINTQMMEIIKSESQKSGIRFSLQYFMMSHYFDSQKDFKREAKDILRLISTTKKSNLSNYSNEDRIVYAKKLWEKVTTDSEIDLRTVEDALKNYALERIKRETVDYMQNWLDSLQDLSTLKTYSRFKEVAARETKSYFMSLKPKHLKEHEIDPYIQVILQILDSRQNKQFMTVLLPHEEDILIEVEYKNKIDKMIGERVAYFKKNMQKKREEIVSGYQAIVRGLREHAKMTKRFVDKIEGANQYYMNHLQHLQNVFKIQLEDALNVETDRQAKGLAFDGSRIQKVISSLEEKHKVEAHPYMPEIWDRIVVRISNVTIVQRIKAEGQAFTTATLGIFMGNQAQRVVDYYRRLQDKVEHFLQNLIVYFNQEEETTATLERFQNIRKLINELIEAKLIEEAKRFKITLVFVAFIMYFFFSEFKFFLKFIGVGKKRFRNWIWLYTLTMLTLFGILIYRKRDYFKKFIEPL